MFQFSDILLWLFQNGVVLFVIPHKTFQNLPGFPSAQEDFTEAMVTWYEKAVFYHMYPLGMTGAPLENSPNTPVVHRFEELNKWFPI
mgnify:CR=1 FL=1